MKEKIWLNDEVAIDLHKLVVSRLLVYATSGGGKSWLLRRILEQSHDKIQQIILDFEGDFLTLLKKFNYVYIGREEGVRITPKTATLFGNKILELNVSAIMDLSEFDVPERMEITAGFLEGLIESPKRFWHKCLVVIDEAQMFCPEGKEKDMTRVGKAVSNLASRGRKRGICGLFSTQRISELKKSVAALCRNKLIGAADQDVDLKRAAYQLGFSNRKEIFSLSELDPGEFYGQGPAISKKVIRFKVGEVQTPHPEIGSRAFIPPQPTSEIIKSALSKLADIPQEAEKKQIAEKELKAEIVRLKRELSVIRSNRTTEHIQADPKMVERQIRQVLMKAKRESDSQIRDIVQRIRDYEKRFNQIGKLIEIKPFELKVQPSGVPFTEGKFERGPLLPRQAIAPSGEPQTKPGPKAAIVYPLQQFKQKVIEEIDGELSGPESRILNAIAWMENIGITEPETTAVAFLSGYTAGGGAFLNPRSSLKAKGLIEYRGSRLILTDEGRARAIIPEDSLTTEELQKRILDRLPGPERKLLKALIEVYPEALTKEELAQKSNYAPGGGAFLNPRGRLKTLGLVEHLKDGQTKASSILFLEER